AISDLKLLPPSIRTIKTGFCATCFRYGIVLAVLGWARTAAQDRPINRSGTQRQIVDMAGRKVALPVQIRKIATIGPVPVLNGFIFAFGEGREIVNGLPDFARVPRYRYQTIFEPSLASKPKMQAGGREPDVEELLKASPDVIFTMDR